MSELSKTQETILNVKIKKFSRLRTSSGVRNVVYFADNTLLSIDWNSTLNKHWNNTEDEEFLVYMKSYLVKNVDRYQHTALRGMGR